MAPDMFYAAAIMQQKEIYYGNGDMNQIIKMLTTMDPTIRGFKDLPNKLFLIKHGHIFKSGILPSLYDPDEPDTKKMIDHFSISDSDKIKLSKDKGQA